MRRWRQGVTEVKKPERGLAKKRHSNIATVKNASFYTQESQFQCTDVFVFSCHPSYLSGSPRHSLYCNESWVYFWVMQCPQWVLKISNCSLMALGAHPLWKIHQTLHNLCARPVLSWKKKKKNPPPFCLKLPALLKPTVSCSAVSNAQDAGL